jgi:ankyrin repeat protein
MCRCGSIFDAHKYRCSQCFDKFSLDPRKLKEFGTIYGTILHMLCRNPVKNKNAIILLLDRGSDPNLIYKGHTPFHHIISRAYDDLELVQRFLDLHLLDVNKATDDMWAETPLHLAIERSEELVVLLLEHPNIDINKQNGDGETPLILAIKLRKINIIKVLLAKDPNLDLQNADGNTALHLCAIFNYPEDAQLLLEHGADLSIRNNRGETVVSCALKRWGYNNDLVRLLQLYESIIDVKNALD